MPEAENRSWAVESSSGRGSVLKEKGVRKPPSPSELVVHVQGMLDLSPGGAFPEFVTVDCRLSKAAAAPSSESPSPFTRWSHQPLAVER